MCVVYFHEAFDARVAEVEATVPDVREYLDGLKWRLEHGEEEGEYLPEYDVYCITYDVCQVFYCLRDSLGEPRVLTVLTVRPRPDRTGSESSSD